MNKMQRCKRHISQKGEMYDDGNASYIVIYTIIQLNRSMKDKPRRRNLSTA
jgi:hypothetical protein